MLTTFSTFCVESADFKSSFQNGCNFAYNPAFMVLKARILLLLICIQVVFSIDVEEVLRSLSMERKCGQMTQVRSKATTQKLHNTLNHFYFYFNDAVDTGSWVG